MKYVIFSMLGILVGLGLFTYGFINKKSQIASRPPSIVQPLPQTTVEELQKNVVIDPVQATEPERIPAESAVTATEQSAQTSQAAGALVDSPPIQDPANPSLASEINPVKPEEVPAQEGWANAAFLPKDTEDSNQSGDVVEENVR